MHWLPTRTDDVLFMDARVCFNFIFLFVTLFVITGGYQKTFTAITMKLPQLSCSGSGHSVNPLVSTVSGHPPVFGLVVSTNIWTPQIFRSASQLINGQKMICSSWGFCVCLVVHYNVYYLCKMHQNTVFVVLCLCEKFYLFLWKSTKTVATIAAPFGTDMHQIVCWLGELTVLPQTSGGDLCLTLGGTRLGVWRTIVPQRVQGQSPGMGSGGQSPASPRSCKLLCIFRA